MVDSVVKDTNLYFKLHFQDIKYFNFFFYFCRVTSCKAYGCTNRWKTGSGHSFHRTPVNKPDLLTKWISAIRRDNWKPKKDMYICRDHFTPDSFLPIKGLGRRKLKPNAVPSIFPKFPQHLQVSPKPNEGLPKSAKLLSLELQARLQRNICMLVNQSLIQISQNRKLCI